MADAVVDGVADVIAPPPSNLPPLEQARNLLAEIAGDVTRRTPADQYFAAYDQLAQLAEQQPTAVPAEFFDVVDQVADELDVYQFGYVLPPLEDRNATYNYVAARIADGEIPSITQAQHRVYRQRLRDRERPEDAPAPTAVSRLRDLGLAGLDIAGSVLGIGRDAVVTTARALGDTAGDVGAAAIDLARGDIEGAADAVSGTAVSIAEGGLQGLEVTRQFGRGVSRLAMRATSIGDVDRADELAWQALQETWRQQQSQTAPSIAGDVAYLITGARDASAPIDREAVRANRDTVVAGMATRGSAIDDAISSRIDPDQVAVARELTALGLLAGGGRGVQAAGQQVARVRSTLRPRLTDSRATADAVRGNVRDRASHYRREAVDPQTARRISPSRADRPSMISAMWREGADAYVGAVGSQTARRAIEAAMTGALTHTIGGGTLVSLAAAALPTAARVAVAASRPALTAARESRIMGVVGTAAQATGNVTRATGAATSRVARNPVAQRLIAGATLRSAVEAAENVLDGPGPRDYDEQVEAAELQLALAAAGDYYDDIVGRDGKPILSWDALTPDSRLAVTRIAAVTGVWPIPVEPSLAQSLGMDKDDPAGIDTETGDIYIAPDSPLRQRALPQLASAVMLQAEIAGHATHLDARTETATLVEMADIMSDIASGVWREDDLVALRDRVADAVDDVYRATPAPAAPAAKAPAAKAPAAKAPAAKAPASKAPASKAPASKAIDAVVDIEDEVVDIEDDPVNDEDEVVDVEVVDDDDPAIGGRSPRQPPRSRQRQPRSNPRPQTLGTALDDDDDDLDSPLGDAILQSLGN